MFQSVNLKCTSIRSSVFIVLHFKSDLDIDTNDEEVLKACTHKMII